MLNTNFSFVSKQKPNQLARRSPWEEDMDCQLSLGLSHWDVCLKTKRTFREAPANVFLPAGFIDRWGFPVSACH